MSKYTLELRHIYDDKTYNLFDFEYNLYDNDLKIYFQEKFFQHFMFNEIGFETIGKFKQRLKSKLNDIYPYYRQLYLTEVRTKNVDFMLNKDLKETFIRDIEGTGINVNNVNNQSNVNNTSVSENFQSDTPQGRIDNIENFMSSADKSRNNNSVNSSDESNSRNESNSKSTEKTEMISQGNIGVTSSAELLQKWRDVLINIDLLIFDELEELFMQIY